MLVNLIGNECAGCVELRTTSHLVRNIQSDAIIYALLYKRIYIIYGARENEIICNDDYRTLVHYVSLFILYDEPIQNSHFFHSVSRCMLWYIMYI